MISFCSYVSGMKVVPREATGVHHEKVGTDHASTWNGSGGISNHLARNGISISTNQFFLRSTSMTSALAQHSWTRTLAIASSSFHRKIFH